MLENIPNELRTYNQWICWRFEEKGGDKPTKVPYCPHNGRLASVTDASTWASFDAARHIFESHDWYDGIGFVLAETDPFVFIDLDDTKGDEKKLAAQIAIYNSFDSYAERSPSGTGCHIIVKGNLPSGRRRGGVEIYSSLRYMTMTGDVIRTSAINDQSAQAMKLWEDLGGGPSVAAFYAGLSEASETNEVVMQRAANAANGQKFVDLYNGNWRDYYDSQSEADFALVDIVAFYSDNKAQIAEIFRQSALGQREKAKRNDYVSYMLNKCFDRKLPPIDSEALMNSIRAIIEEKEKVKKSKVSKLPQSPDDHDAIYRLPPGLVGEIAKFIMAAAPRPVREIALVGAIGLMAGICGRSFNVSGTGLNQYLLLLAPTGTGKEAMARGTNKLMTAVRKIVPTTNEFIGPGEISSSAAIIKYMAAGRTSFVSISGEFGMHLQQMAAKNAPPHLLGLRRFMLDAFAKSGEGETLQPSIYSDKEKNTTAIQSPAFSILGESTPEKFYEGLHEGLISEGLLPRFTVIEYKGKRPPLSKTYESAVVDPALIQSLGDLCSYSAMLNAQNKAVKVAMNSQAILMFEQFNVHCDENINATDAEVKRHLWNRAHLKALKLAAIVAIGIDKTNPTITEHESSWAINIVVADVRNMLSRFDAGEIGIDNDETKQLAKVSSVVSDFIGLTLDDFSKYCPNNQALFNARILPFSYVQRRCASIAVFRNDRQGATLAIKRALRTLCERGDLQEMSKAQTMKDHGTAALCFGITNAKAFS